MCYINRLRILFSSFILPSIIFSFHSTEKRLSKWLYFRLNWNFNLDRKRTSHPADFHQTMRSTRRGVAVAAESKSHRDLRYPVESSVLVRFECAPMSTLPGGLTHPGARLLVSSTRTRELPRIEEAMDARKKFSVKILNEKYIIIIIMTLYNRFVIISLGCIYVCI